jgi:phosphatidylinositol phospholipase C delta
MEDVTVPQLLQQGTPMTKVSALKQKKYLFRLDPDAGQITWESKKHRIRESNSLTILNRTPPK